MDFAKKEALFKLLTFLLTVTRDKLVVNQSDLLKLCYILVEKKY